MVTLWRTGAFIGAFDLVWLVGSPVVGNMQSVSGQRTAADVTVDSCIVEMTGDVNQSGDINSADIIYLVRWIFNRGPAPEPCIGAADVNCTVAVITADVIYSVGFVFKSGPAPCDVCPLIQAATWTCP